MVCNSTMKPSTTDDLCECPCCGRMHRHLGTPPWALSHDDLCRLSRLFGFAGDIRTSQDYRINEWLKRMIGTSETKP